MKKVVLNKGYTVRTVSWENDGDNYRTIDTHCQNVENVKALIAVCNYCRTTHTGESIANEYADEPDNKIINKLKDILQEHPILVNYLDDDENPEAYAVIDAAKELFGYSEYYLSRVCESYEILYAKEDVTVEVRKVGDI